MKSTVFKKTISFLNYRITKNQTIFNFGFLLKTTQWDPRNLRHVCFSTVDNSLIIEAESINMPR